MRALAVLFVVAVVAPSRTVSAQPTRVVVATTDRVLVSALADALFPTGTIVLPVDDAPPAAVGELASTSRAVATRENAAAVVWLLVDRAGATLVIYDRGVDRILVRPLPYAPPLSPANAAETARAARTMLRALKLADEPEPVTPAAPLEVVAAPAASTPRRSRHLVGYAGLGGRYGRLGEDGVVEATVAAAWRPDALGVIGMISVSAVASLSSPAFMGEVTDHSIALATRLPLALGPRIAVAGYAGPALHAIRVEGTLGAEEVSVLRYDAALRIGASGGYALTDRVELGLAISMDTLIRRQRYEVPGGQVLTMPRLQLSAGLQIAVRVL